MSKSSEAVKKWRRNTKEKIVTSMGKNCQICHYDKTPSALALHHLDPTKKDFSMGSIRAHPKNIKLILNELEKCILLCHNCHTEVHEGIAKIPHEYYKLDRTIFEVLKVKPIDFCPVCNKEKSMANVTCSLKCAGINRRKIDWDSIPKEWFKTKTNVYIAEVLGVSDKAVSKHKRKFNLT